MTIYEGLLVGKSLGIIAEAVRPLGKLHIAAFLDTPLDVCIARVEQRRLEAGNDKPLNPRNLTGDHRLLQSCHRRAGPFGLNVVDIPYQTAIASSLAAIKLGLRHAHQ